MHISEIHIFHKNQLFAYIYHGRNKELYQFLATPIFYDELSFYNRSLHIFYNRSLHIFYKYKFNILQTQVYIYFTNFLVA